jgi:hypothetical protein
VRYSVHLPPGVRCLTRPHVGETLVSTKWRYNPQHWSITARSEGWAASLV